MAIINLTPDSFSNDGISDLSKPQIINNIAKVLNCKPDIIDLGAESSRPGSKPITHEQEWGRFGHCLEYLSKIQNKQQLPAISIDTTKHKIIQEASKLVKIDIINNISPVVSKDMVETAKKLDAKLVIMHNAAKEVDYSINNIPIYSRPNEPNFFSKFISEAQKQIQNALDFGLAEDKIIFDPGLGFGKSLEQNIELIVKIKQIKKILPFEILIGASRKSFLKVITESSNYSKKDNDKSHILPASLAVLAYASINGVDIIRLHDIKESIQFHKVMSKLIYK